MSWQSMTDELRVGDRRIQSFAWYGKLPSAGDFISRRMPYVLQQFWDAWLAAGMESLKERHPVSGWAVWGTMPKWAFLLPCQPGVPIAQLGVLAPSCDRVGRVFPFLATTAVVPDNAAHLLPRAGAISLAWGAVIADAQTARSMVEAVDARLGDALSTSLANDVPIADTEVTLPHGVSPATLPWPGIAEQFDIQGSESFWWSVPPATTGFRAKTHQGPLNATQFCGLSL
jgi:type VI secretion system protein ImpM